MQTEVCRMAGVSSRNGNEKVLLTKSLLQYAATEFSYATMLDKSPNDLPDSVFSNTMPVVAHKVMLHMALKRGLTEFSLKGKKAVSTELMQIHVQNTFLLKHYNELTLEKRQKALEYCCSSNRRNHETSRVEECVLMAVHNARILRRERRHRPQ